MTFRCCDCGEDFDTQSLLEQHISVEHLSWSPYWCLYCKQKGVTLKKATKDALKVHVEKIHPAEQFLFIYEPDDAKEEEQRDKLNRSLALPAQDDTAHHSLLSPAPTPVSPSTSSALEPKLEPFEDAEFQLPNNSNDMGWQFSSPLSHCLTCGTEILNDGHKHSCQFPSTDKPMVDPTDNKQEVLSHQLGELFSPDNLINEGPTPTPTSKGKKKFACTVCGKEYSSPLSLRMHEDSKMHWGLLEHLTRLECDLCPAKYHFSKPLRLHKKRLHNAEPNTAQDDTAHHSLLSPAPTQVSPLTSSALKPKLEEEFQIPANSSDTGWQFSSPLSHCLTCGAQILNDGHKHQCQFSPSMDKAVDPPDNKQEGLSYQIGELFTPDNLINKQQTPTPMSKAKKKFTCTVCGKEYDTPLSLRKHEDAKMHWGLLKHLTRSECDFCPAKFHYATALQLHRKKLHNADPQPLPNIGVTCWCHRKFTSETQLLIHKDHHQHHTKSAQNGLQKCPMCPKKYHLEAILKGHMRSHQPKANKRKMKKSQLGPPTNSKSVVSIHQPPSISNRRASELEHAKVEFSEKPVFKCSMCPKEYEKLYNLRSHEDLKMHWGTLKHLTEYHCETCNRTFHFRHMLYMHKEMIDDNDNNERIEQPAPSTQLKCQLCDRVFRHEAGLSKHMCHGKPRYRCKLCEQEFDNLETLDLHRVNYNHHETKKPIVPVACPSCNKSFTNKRSLTVHKTSVHNEKKANLKPGSFMDCAGCGKVCKSLKRHKHQCPHFKQGIAQAQTIIYSCSMCPRKFNSIVTMRLHQRAHRNETNPTKVMSTCVPCSKSLAPSEIDSHLLKVHIKKVNNQVTLIQGDGNEWDQTNIFDGDLMSKVREKLIVQDQMETPKLKLEALKCKHCGKQFTTEEKLKKHQEMLMTSKLLSAKVGLRQWKQGDKHLMAKLCIKKSVKLF